jgi:hypothetical protein
MYQLLFNTFIGIPNAFQPSIDHCWSNRQDLKTRCKEHINDISKNVEKSRYAVYMLKENHEYGPIEKVMNVLKVENKGKILHL